MDVRIETFDTTAAFAAQDLAHRPSTAVEPMASRVFFGDCAIDTAAHAFYIQGVERHLEPRGFEVLLYLIRHRNRVVSKHELLDFIWPTWHVTENVVARCVMKLRRAIGDDVRGGRIIRTIHRVGYRFDANVQQGWAGDRGALVSEVPERQRQQVAALDSVRMALYAPVAKSVDAQDLKKI